MLGLLLGVQIAVAFISALAIAMIRNHFRKLEASLHIYANPRAYTPKERIAFIAHVIQKLNPDAKELDDLAFVEEGVQEAFYKERIGCFSYKSVQFFAIQGKYLLWIIFLVQAAIQLSGQLTGMGTSQFVSNVISSLLCMGFMLLGVVLNVGEQKKQLLKAIACYVSSGYHQQLRSRQKDSLSEQKFNKLNDFPFEQDKLAKEQEKVEQMGEDIKNVLKIFEKEA